MDVDDKKKSEDLISEFSKLDRSRQIEIADEIDDILGDFPEELPDELEEE